MNNNFISKCRLLIQYTIQTFTNVLFMIIGKANYRNFYIMHRLINIPLSDFF